MKNAPFHEYLKQKAAAKVGSTLAHLWGFLGLQKAVVYRKINRLPWTAFGGCDYRIAERISERLPDNRNKVLWLMGYNPFIAEGLSADELITIYEINMRIAHLVKSGQFAKMDELGGVNSLLGVSMQSLKRLSYERLKAEKGES